MRPEESLLDDVRSFLAAAIGPFRARHGDEPVASFATRLAWQRVLHAGGWAAPAWPVEHGGRGLAGAALFACETAFAEAGAPLVAGNLGIHNVGPAIIDFGTPDQQGSLARILSGEEIWCQGFSEPDAGSDLASLRTRAVRGGDAYIVDGQKVWTSDGMQATHCQLLVRSEPDAPRHRGITCLLVPLDLAGITRRPLLTLSGDAEFSELFFDAVEVPVSAVLGEPEGGWRVATATLAHERIGVATRAASLRREVDAALRAVGPSASWATRAELVRRWSEARVLELLTQRVVAGGGGPAASALAKLSWGRLEQAATTAIADAWGLGAVGGEAEAAAYRFLLARQATIGAGTSEVLRNVIAEQALGLPREALAREDESSNDRTNQALGGARGRP